MAWEEIDNIKPQAIDAVPRDGVRLRTRLFKSRRGPKSWIELAIGGGLARRLSLTLPEQRLRMLLGSGEEAGQMMLAPDQERGKFTAKRRKNGTYGVAISQSSAEGLFSMQFAPFAVIEVAVEKAPGCPPAALFALSEAMLAVDD